MKYLVTGGAGFIGANFVHYLLKKYPDCEVVNLDKLTYAGNLDNHREIENDPRYTFVKGDIADAKLVNSLFEAGLDYVVNFAAETHVARSIFDDAIFFETDVIGTQRIANAVLQNKKKIKKFVHISTSEVYGTASAPKMSEKHPLNPMSPYAAAKVGADRLVYSYVQTYNIPAVIIRPFNMYGPQQHLEKLVPRFVTSCILGEPFTIHGSGKSSRDFTYVEDLAMAVDLVMHAPAKKVDGEVFNVGSEKSHSVKEIADIIMKIMSSGKGKLKYRSSVMNIGDRPGQVFRHTADTSKIRKILGWKPMVHLEDGLKKTIDWYVNNKEWWKDKLWMRCVPIETEKGKTEMH